MAVGRWDGGVVPLPWIECCSLFHAACEMSKMDETNLAAARACQVRVAAAAPGVAGRAVAAAAAWAAAASAARGAAAASWVAAAPAAGGAAALVVAGRAATAAAAWATARRRWRQGWWRRQG